MQNEGAEVYPVTITKDKQPDYAIHIINLDRDLARLERARARFAAIGLELERFPGVDGSKIDQITRLFSQTERRPLQNGELGCALSHVGVWQKIASGSADHALIFEDDARPLREFPPCFTDFGLPASYDLCYINSRMIFKSSKLQKEPQTVVPLMQAILEFDDSLMAQAAGLDGYLVSRKGAQRLIKIIRNDRVMAPIDLQVMVAGLNEDDLNLLAENFKRRGTTFRTIQNRRTIKDTIEAYVLTPSLTRQDDGGVSTRRQISAE